MKITLNEREVIDGCCCAVDVNDPESVTVKNLTFENGIFRAYAHQDSVFKNEHYLTESDIIRGIHALLISYVLELETDYINANEAQIQLNFTEGEGIWAEVLL